MLTIRMQRTGRTGHAQFRVVAQDRRFSPLSGRVVAYLGSYNPHTKESKLDGQKIGEYLEQGAQPSPRVIKLLKSEGIKLPKWVSEPTSKKKTTRNPEKLRKNRPAEVTEKPAEPTAEAPVAEQTPADPKAEAETPVEAETPETVEETPAETTEEAPDEPAEEDETKTEA